MGYGVPAAIAAKSVHPDRMVVAFSGDGDFLMTGQELATAVQYGLPIIVVLVNNGCYGTIRMHQEREYPGRVYGTRPRNPDFVALCARRSERSASRWRPRSSSRRRSSAQPRAAFLRPRAAAPRRK